MLTLKDLPSSRELDHDAMADIAGGDWFCGTPPRRPGGPVGVPADIEDVLKEAIGGLPSPWDPVRPYKAPYGQGVPVRNPL
ncbi:MAG: hypothetical protein PVI91_03830 [Gammaproteobacteria bacterium]|jgi:hypothetical protein